MRRRRQRRAALPATLPTLGFASGRRPVSRCQAAHIRLALERRGERIGPLDTLVAATVPACGATLVTRNTKEFGCKAGLKVANWHG